MTPTPEEMTERLIDAAVEYERAVGIYAAPARRELSEARAAIEAALHERDNSAQSIGL